MFRSIVEVEKLKQRLSDKAISSFMSCIELFTSILSVLHDIIISLSLGSRNEKIISSINSLKPSLI